MEKDKILEMYNYHLSGFSYLEVAEKFNTNRHAVYVLFKKSGLKGSRKLNKYRGKPVKPKKEKRKKTDYSDVIDLYNSGMKSEDIAIVKGIHRENIAKFLFRTNNIKPRRVGYPVNEDFFNVVNTEEKAYLLGFFYADGCITDNSSIQVLIQKNDMEILEYFRNALSPTKPIQTYTYKKDGVNRQDQGKFKTTSKPLYDSLIKLGFTERKTYNDFSMSFIPDTLKKDFIRGFIDGDGCWTFKIKGNNHIRRMSTVSMCKTLIYEIKAYFDSINVYSTITTSKTKKGLDMYYNNVAALSSMQLLYKNLYENANFYLKRKQVKAFNCTLTPRELIGLKIY